MKYFTTRKQWRSWLEKNHDKKEIWLVYYKKHTNKPTIKYEDAVEEAICFGWIDGKVNRIDDERYMQRFTPRNPDSVWSLLNKNRAEKMIKQGLMTKLGLEKIKAAKKSGKWHAAYSSKTKPKLPLDIKKALEKKTLENFNNFTNSQQLLYIYWVLSAKRPETRKKRIMELKKIAEQKNI